MIMAAQAASNNKGKKGKKKVINPFLATGS
jgi:hypothetical protein